MLFFACGCVKAPENIPAHVKMTTLPVSIAQLPSPVALQESEKNLPWGLEYFLGKQFAKQADYYRAATCFHRSLLLLPPESSYYPVLFHALVLTYSMAGKYEEITSLYERCKGDLRVSDPKLALDCIGLLSEAYYYQDKTLDAEKLIAQLPKSEVQAQTLPLFLALSSNKEQCFSEAEKASSGLSEAMKKDVSSIAKLYSASKKHPETAATLNAILPGAGYAYVRQYQTAATALLFNGLFIAATCQLCAAHQVAAGLIAGGFETGWYAGGIMGAHMAAYTYNDTLRSQLISEFLHKYKLFPLEQLHYQW